jgi:outer membrane receptor protein involved in Fe transport
MASLAAAAVSAASADEAVARHFAIQSQPLTSALRAYAEETGDQVVFFSDIGKDKQSGEVVGDFTNDIALAKLLARSGLSFERLDAHTIAIATGKVSAANAARSSKTRLLRQEAGAQPLAQASSDSVSSPEGPAAVLAAGAPAQDLLPQLDEVVVTGTHIRGELPAGSSLRVYSHQALEQSGAGTVDQFARQMTENFSGADTVANTNSNIGNSRFNGGGINNGFQGSSFDLHGLGPTATLTLLNGHRLAPGGYDGSLVDMSQIPLSAVDHIEVLADGASAIYGADAVAGVVNIVTRKDFTGAETQLRYGNTTDGGASEYTGSQLLGTSWGSGNALINYEYDKQNGLDASERAYIPAQGGADLLIPINRRNSVLATASQSLAERTTLSVDGIYSDREYGTRQFLTV